MEAPERWVRLNENWASKMVWRVLKMLTMQPDDLSSIHRVEGKN